ncbi:MAG: DUF3575 domain-containing protein [Bacteroidales bacterium]|jgi:hypothetical protein|nr:DUF3575 domain-containing protein [Bacteroidales bacterium]
MKKFIVLIALVLAGVSVEAQDDRVHEVKLDAVYLFTGTIKADYEYLLGDYMTAGGSVLFNFYSKNPVSKAHVLGLFRIYLGDKNDNQLSGLYFEGNLGLHAGQGLDFKGDSYSAFGMGLAAGYKWVFPKPGLTIDLYGGIGRLFDKEEGGFYPRVGACIGKRF